MVQGRVMHAAMFACGKVVDNNIICFRKIDKLPEQLTKVRDRPDH